MSQRRERLLPQRQNTILLDSYNSPTDGPTIYIDVQSLARLNEIEALMRDLAAGKSKCFAVSELTDTYWVPPIREISLSISKSELLVTAQQNGEELGRERCGERASRRMSCGTWVRIKKLKFRSLREPSRPVAQSAPVQNIP
jgi:hypothetical protein